MTTADATPAPHSDEPLVASGLSGLRAALPDKKGLLARRLVAAGRTPTRFDFDKQGLRLSPDEETLLQRWLAAGLVTRVDKETRAKDGTVKLLLALRDGKKVETVAMPIGACCVSTQVGCAVGCRFCASGLFGVERHLAVDEIVEQVVHARRHMRIDRIVFMGMGEPSHNLDNVMAAVARIHEEALISPKRQTFSTVGGVKPLARMREFAVKPCLALSLHSANEQKRRELLPRAHKDPLPEIVAAADAYAQDVGTPIQFEWTMLAGINDSDQDVDELCALLQGVRGYVNFIVYNPVDGLPFCAPSRERIVAMVRAVKARGILATIRDSSGPDAEAACGQLRLRDRTG
ncbi:MAG: radical SAM protein [Phycisphaerales bacterium]|nr:radical SAM protein [Phycisphaerales bacterium]